MPGNRSARAGVTCVADLATDGVLPARAPADDARTGCVSRRAACT
jgi:hypothetical protein